MSGFFELLDRPMGRQLIQGVSREKNQPEGNTADVLGIALPLLMGAIKKNASYP